VFSKNQDMRLGHSSENGAEYELEDEDENDFGTSVRLEKFLPGDWRFVYPNRPIEFWVTALCVL